MHLENSSPHLALDGNWSLKDGMHAQDGGLGRVDDGSAKHGPEDPSVGDGEGPSIHVLNGEEAITSLCVRVYVCMCEYVKEGWSYV